VLDNVIKKHTINSGRRGQINSTVIRQETNGSNAGGGRVIIKKKALGSPSND